MTYLFINKTLSPNNLQIRTVINAKISVFVVCVEAIVYLLLYKLHGCTFNVYIYFTGIFFVVFHLKTLFLLFSLFFWLNIKFRKQNINQSETRIGDEKLSREMYIEHFTANVDSTFTNKTNRRFRDRIIYRNMGIFIASARWRIITRTIKNNYRNMFKVRYVKGSWARLIK